MNKKSSSKKSTSKAVKPSDRREKSPPDHLLYVLKGGGAHITFDHALGDRDLQLARGKVADFPHTARMLVAHMRLPPRDILDFSRNSKYVSAAWPEGYWPKSEAPPDEKAWTASMATFKKDLRTMQQLVSDRKIDLYARIPWGDGQTILREALLLADHNAYHLGQLVMLRKSIGI